MPSEFSGKMNFKKIFFSSVLFLFIMALTACGAGEELCRIEGESNTFILYGGANAITKVEVLKDGAVIASVDPEYRVNEPWLGEDKEDYGFSVCDLNADGLDDFVIKTVRTAGAEKYIFFINKDGDFKLEKALSGAVAPTFGDGTVRVKTFERYDQPTYANEPAIYELRQEETFYGWSEHGRLEIRQVIRYSYFSETDIYRYSVFKPNEEGDLEAESEKWIYPDKLGEYGLIPLK